VDDYKHIKHVERRRLQCRVVMVFGGKSGDLPMEDPPFEKSRGHDF